MFKTRVKRYAGLITAITLLVAFVVIVIIGNNYVDTHIIQRDYYSASRTENFSQVIQRVGPEDEKLRRDILEHLHLLRDGGEIVSAYGPRWQKDAVTDQRVLDAIAEVDAAEKAGDYPAFKEAYLSFSQVSAKSGFEALGRLERIQFIIVGVILVGFVGILAMLFFRLGRTDDQVRRMLSENKKILSSVDSGLFLLDPNFQIGEQRSDALTTIFGDSDYVKGNFFDILNGLVSSQDQELAKEFIELLFEGRVIQDLVQDLNPLKEVEMNVVSSGGVPKKKYLNFKFVRDDDADAKDSILVSVVDVTNEITLRNELENTKEMQKERMNLFLGLLHVEPEKLLNFCESSSQAMIGINNILSDEDVGRVSMVRKLDDIARRAHRIKGDAGVLGLTLFETSVHRFETEIEKLKEMSRVDGNAILELTVQLRDMISETETVKNLVPQLRTLGLDSGSASSRESSRISVPGDRSEELDEGQIAVSSNRIFTKSMQLLVDNACERLGNKAIVDTAGFEALQNKPETLAKLTSICTQLLRNCVAHGIEAPEDRLKLSKASFGVIRINLTSSDDGGISLVVQDDGRGLQFDQIRARAIERNLLSTENSLKTQNRDLLKFLFMPGFSSSDDVSLDAGRGMGLDLVRNEVLSMGGKISLSTQDGHFTRFVFGFPVVAQ